ncbi:MAG: ferritin family protein [Candidatus Methanoperedens sp.]|nr:ferritin family protein [Candidatus Methanoperedens sp.]
MLINILKEAISIEIYGREYYLRFSDLIEDENARSIFRGLSRDEEEHLMLLENEYNKIAVMPFDARDDDATNKEKANSIFPESHKSLNVKETVDVLKLGIRTEERSIELYSNAAKKTDVGSSKDLFMKLAQIERKHKEMLEDSMYYFDQGGSWYGYSPPSLEG